jgi:2,3-bisphosphoglycerate-independent phosphoglycerate mutase
VGLGEPDPRRNPFAAAHAPTLAELAGGPWLHGLRRVAEPGRTVAALDATLGDPGRPQSATGQSTLLTGRDAVAVMGGPYGPWPGPRLRAFLERDTLFHDAAAAAPGVGGALANAYPDAYLDALARPTGRHRRARAPAAVVAARAAGVPLRGREAWAAGRAVAPDLDGSGWHRSPRGGAGGAGAADGPRGGGGRGVGREAARLAALAADHPLTYLDVWLTDQVGHRAELATATALVERLDRFVAALLEALPSRVTLVVSSDHGNLEDALDRRHTHAEVPLIVLGPAAAAFSEARDLRDVAPAVRAAWGGQGPSTMTSTASYQAPASSSSPAGTSSDAACRAADG